MSAWQVDPDPTSSPAIIASDGSRFLELAGAWPAGDVPRRAQIVGRIEEGSLQGCKNAKGDTLTQAGNVRQSVFGRTAKGLLR